MKYIIFSKDRPLQLTACLESLFVKTNAKKEDINIIIPNKNNYETLITEQSDIHWYFEENHGGFDRTFKLILNSINENECITFIVDDVVWFDNVDFDEASLYLKNNNEILGLSYRLGKNILWFNRLINYSKDNKYFTWRWKNAPGHAGYCPELTSSSYRISIIKSLLEGKTFRIPNDVESALVTGLYNKSDKYPQFMSCYNKNFSCAAIDLNRVQNLYPNRIQGDPNEHSVENLLNLYKEGYRINIKNYENIVHYDCFLGTKNLEFIK